MADSSRVLVQLRLIGASVFAREASASAKELGRIGAAGDAAGAGLTRASAGGIKASESLARVNKIAAVTTGAIGRVRGTVGALLSPLARLGSVASLGAGFGLYEAGKATISFDRGMRNVNSIAGLSERNFQILDKRVNALAGPTAQAPTTLAEGMYDLVSSGFNANQSLKILRSSARAATAGLTDTATSTHAVAAVLNAYHLAADKAGKVSDILFQTVNRGVITFPELADTIGDVLPFASSLHVGLKQVGAAVSTMTKEGINAPETMTRLKNVMQAFIKPSAGMTKALAATGAASGEQLVKSKGLQGALEAVINSTDGSKASIAKLFPNIRGLGGALALTGKNARSAHNDLRGFANVRGITNKVLAEQSKSLSFQWNRLKATTTGLATSLGLRLIPFATKAVGVISKLMRGQGTVGKFLSGLTGQTTTTRRIEAPGGRVATVPQRATGAQGAGAAVHDAIGSVVKTGLSIARQVVPAVKSTVTQLLTAMKPAIPFFQNILLPLLKGVAKGIIGGIVFAFKILIPIVRVVATVLGFLGRLAAPLRPVFEKIGEVIGFVFGGPILDAVRGLRIFAGAIGGGSRVARIFHAVLSALRAPTRIATNVIKFLARGVRGLISGFGRAFQFVQRFAGTLKGGTRRVILTATNMVGGVIHTIETLPGRVAGIIGRLISRIVGKLGGASARIFRGALNIGKGIVRGLVNAVKSAGGQLLGALHGALQWAVDKLPLPGFIKGKVKGLLGLHAAGGTVRTPLQVVGEQGPELAAFPNGTRIYPATTTRRVLSGQSGSATPVSMAAPQFVMPPVIHTHVWIGRKEIADAVHEFDRSVLEAR